jgi:hypothetical protein
MKARLFLLGLAVAAQLSAQPFTVRITADNYYAVYTGTSTAATTRHFTGAWPSVMTPAPITPPAGSNVLYVVAWDDGQALQGLLATVGVGGGFVTTGSPLWKVCATHTLPSSGTASSPTPASLTQTIAACNQGNSWHATSNGVSNYNSDAAGFWGQVQQIDGLANWIWDTDKSAACNGPQGPLSGPCNPGEYLIFRLPLASVATCLPPVPAFTIDWSAGYGTFVADGTNSQNEQSHFWSLQESDSSWRGTGPEITQWFVDQQAGVFDLKAFFEERGQMLKCDTSYRVKLAVSNQCVPWRDTTRLVTLKCCAGEVDAPTPTAIPLISVCDGECGEPVSVPIPITSSDLAGCPGLHCNLQIKILDGELCPNRAVKVDLRNGSAWSWTRTYFLPDVTPLPGSVSPGFIEVLPRKSVAPGDVLTLTTQLVSSGSSSVCKRLGNFRFELFALH